MTRLRRRAFGVAAAGSAVLLAATAVVWVRSYWVYEAVSWRSSTSETSLDISRGEAVVSRGTGLSIPSYDRGFYYYTQWPRPFPEIKPVAGGAGFYIARFHFRDPVEDTSYLYAPCWSLAALFAVPPALWLAAWRRHRRRLTAGCCAHCGYDLRATPGRCPECGAVPAPPGAAAARYDPPP